MKLYYVSLHKILLKTIFFMLVT